MMWTKSGDNKWHTTDTKPLVCEIAKVDQSFCVWRIRLDNKTIKQGRAIHPLAAMETVRLKFNTIDLEIEGDKVC